MGSERNPIRDIAHNNLTQAHMAKIAPSELDSQAEHGDNTVHRLAVPSHGAAPCSTGRDVRVGARMVQTPELALNGMRKEDGVTSREQR